MILRSPRPYPARRIDTPESPQRILPAKPLIWRSTTICRSGRGCNDDALSRQAQRLIAQSQHDPDPQPSNKREQRVQGNTSQPNSLTSWNSRPPHPELPVIGYNHFHREARADAHSNSPVVVCYQSLDKLQRGLAEKKRALTNSPTDNRQLLLAPFFPCDFPHG